MPIEERLSPPLSHWPNADEIGRLAAEGALIVLPDRVSVVRDDTVASFREDAQALRVRGRERGLRVELFAPKGARLGVYREHAAEWILPVVAFLGGQSASIIFNLIANEIQRRLDMWREGRPGRLPMVRYREVVVENERAQLREIEGPAEEVIAWLREQRGQLPPSDVEESGA